MISLKNKRRQKLQQSSTKAFKKIKKSEQTEVEATEVDPPPKETESKTENGQMVEVSSEKMKEEEDLSFNEQETEQVQQTTEGGTLKLHLSKQFKPFYVNQKIYTGGKVQFCQSEGAFLCQSDFKINVFDLQANKVTSTISHSPEEITNFTLHPSDNFIATFTRNETLRFLSLKENLAVNQWKLANFYAIDMVFDRSGVFLALGGVDGSIRIINIKTTKITHNYKIHRACVTRLAFHPNYQKMVLISAGDDYFIRVYDMITSNCLVSFSTHESQITVLQFTDNGTNFISAGADKKIIIWDYINLQRQATIEYDEEIEALTQFKLSSKEGKHKTQKFLAISGQSGVIKLIDIAGKEIKIASFDDLSTNTVLKLIALEKTQKLAAITSEQNILLFDVQEGPTLHPAATIIGFNDEITDAKFSKKKNQNHKFNISEELIAYSTNSQYLRVLDMKTKQTQLLKGHTDIVLCLDFFEQFIVSAGKDKQIILWVQDGPTFRVLCTMHGHIEEINSVCFSPKSGKLLASVSQDKSLKTWAIESLIRKGVKIQEASVVQSSKRTVHAHEKDINAVKFAPNEKLLATSSQDRSIKIWDASSLSCVMQLAGHKRGVWDIAFNPVEKLIASASGDNTIKVWNLDDGQCVNTFQGHENTVLKVQWACLGLELVSSGADGLIKLWNVKKNICLNTLDNHEGKIWALDVSRGDPTQKPFILSAGNDSIINVWEDTTRSDDQQKLQEKHKVNLELQEIDEFIRIEDYYAAVVQSFKSNFLKNFILALEMFYDHQDFTNHFIYSEQNADFSLENQENSLKSLELVKELIKIDINRLISYIRNLNCSHKTYRYAQRLLGCLLRSVHPNEFENISKKFYDNTFLSGKKSKEQVSCKDQMFNIIDAIIAYSEQHYQRLQKAVKKTYYLDFFLMKCNVVPEKLV